MHALFGHLKELYTSGTTLSEMINWTPLSNELRGKKRTGPSKKRTDSNFFHDFQGGGGPNRIFPLNLLLRGVQSIISDRVVPEV